MANPWQVTLTPTGWWEVRYGDGPDDVVSFPPGREREARMCAAAPVMQAEIRNSMYFIYGYFGPTSNDGISGWSDDDARKIVINDNQPGRTLR